jgi:hypothetical protein
MKLRITVVCDLEVEDLSDYEATTIEEAAANQKRWFDDQPGLVTEVFGWHQIQEIKVEPIP